MSSIGNADQLKHCFREEAREIIVDLESALLELNEDRSDMDLIGRVFVVDQVLGDRQTVIKNLGRVYRHVQVVSGATILGNGSVALILDPERLVQDVLRDQAKGSLNRLVPQYNESSHRRDGSMVNAS